MRLVRKFLLLLLLLAAAPAVIRAADDLPQKISDAEFARLMTDFSEPNGRFQYENFVSNEYNLQSVIPAVTEASGAASAYIGVGPEQNFTYIAALHPKIAFIIDIRRQNLLEQLMYKAVFELAQDRADFLALLFGRRRPVGLKTESTTEELFKPFRSAPEDRTIFEQNLEKIMHRLIVNHKLTITDEDRATIRYVYNTFFEHGSALDYTVGGFYGSDNPPTFEDLMTADDGHGVMRSFLASDENFRIVKKLEENNLVIPVVGDFAGPRAVREVGRYVAAHHGRVTAFYLSNVERYLFSSPGAWRKFYVNVAILPYDKQSLFIRSMFDSSYGSVNKLSAIDDVMKAFSESRINSYDDVVGLSY